MNICENCVHCWRDDTVGERECMIAEELSEEQLVKYFENMEPGCPYYMTQEDQTDSYIQALNNIPVNPDSLRFYV